MRVVNRFRWRHEISIHEPFEELCVLAAAGQILSADWERLQTHLEECEACRSVFADAGEIHCQWLPQRSNFEITRDPSTESLLKSRILKQISRDGGRLSKAVLCVRPKGEGLARLRKLAIPALSFAAGACFVVVATRMGRSGNLPRPDKQRAEVSAQIVPSKNEKPQIPKVVTPNNATETAARETALETQLGATRARENELERQLRNARARADDLQQDNAAVKQEVIDLQRLLQNLRLTEGKTEAELASLKESQSTKDVVMSAQEQEILQLRDKLDAQSASLSRERDLMSAGREIRDLIAARNLHIVDVYDTDESGRTRKSFGRVFYTEGKSLVFYAYDLPTHGIVNAKYAYYAWGKRDRGASRTVRKLGILYNDDQAQRRWVLTVTDPAVLAEIDSVFVTLERTDDSGDGPRGKKVLSTYLVGPPNHP